MKKAKTAPKKAAAATPAQQIDARIEALNDWRGKTLARVRALIHAAEATRVYQLHAYVKQRRKAYEAWERELKKIVGLEAPKKRAKKSAKAGTQPPQAAKLSS